MPHDHCDQYDPEKTSQAIHQHTGGDGLNPMVMMHADLKTCFRIVGENKDTLDKKDDALSGRIGDMETSDSDQGARIKALEATIKSLQNRLWGLLAGVILAVIGGAITWLTT